MSDCIFLFKFLSFLFIFQSIALIDSSANDETNDFNIFLTINAVNRRIEINWLSGPIDSKHTLLITDRKVDNFKLDHYSFTHDDQVYATNYWKTDNEDATILHYTSLEGAEGRKLSNIIFNDDLWKDLDYEPTCYGYWWHYVTEHGDKLAEGCYSTHPTWMNEMRDKIKDLKFRQLFIPGTHDSGSYRSDFRLVPNENIAAKYAYTQDEDIRTQLIHGIRYLDIRVAHYRLDKHKFWVNHGVYKMNPLIDVLRQVRDFVEATNEIVIFDIQEFPVGFKTNEMEIHRQLISLLYSEIGQYSVDPSQGWELSLNDVWRQGKNIIISYDHKQVREEFPEFVFREVQHRWGNVQSLADLIEYIKKTRRETAMVMDYRPFSDMAQLTPTALDVITDRFKGLRNMADMVNFEMGRLYRTELGFTSNAVAIDFYHGSNVVSNALYWNKKKNF